MRSGEVRRETSWRCVLDEMQGAKAMATIKGKASNAPEDTGTQQARGPKSNSVQARAERQSKGSP